MRRKILHIITSLTEGGAQKILIDVCRFSKNNTEHRVICLKDGRYSEILKKNGIVVYKLNFKENPIKSTSELLSILNKKFEPHIVHTWLYHSDLIGCILKLFWKRADKKLFWNIRNGTLQKKTSSRKTRYIRKLLILLSYVSPDKIIYCSNNVRKIHESIGYLKKIGLTINNGVDTTFFNLIERKDFDKDNYKIGFIGRYDKQKDLDTLFKATEILNKENVKISLDLTGEGFNEKNKSLKDKIDFYKINKITKYNGVKKDIRKTLKNLDLFILTSCSGEGFPNILLEAMSTGLRCISTDVGESENIISKYGWIIKPKDIDSLVKYIKESIQQKSKERINMQLEARKHIQNKFDLKIMLNSYNSIYK